MPVVFLDIGNARDLYVDSLSRAGIGVTAQDSTTAIVVASDGRYISVRGRSGEDVQLSGDIAPDDLAQVVKVIVALDGARKHVRASQEAERRLLAASTMVHDANNALLPVLFAAQALLDGECPPASVAQQVLDGATHIASMFRKFLNPRRAVAAEPLDVNDALAGLMQLMQPMKGRSVEVVTQLEHAIPRVAIDPDEFARVMINLVANARDSVSDAGPIRVSTSLIHTSQSGLGAMRPGCWVLITVEDRGSGMDRVTLARAAEPFFTTKQHVGGTGLGLSSALQIVQQAGGHLRIESTLEVGTRVQVFLPV